MVISDTLAVILVAYLGTGMSLVGYDLSAPPEKRKRYAMHLNMFVILAIWFLWPLTMFVSAYKEQAKRRGGMRYLVGVLLVAGGMYVLADVVYSVAGKVVDILWMKAAVTLVVIVMAAPVLMLIAMPKNR